MVGLRSSPSNELGEIGVQVSSHAPPGLIAGWQTFLLFLGNRTTSKEKTQSAFLLNLHLITPFDNPRTSFLDQAIDILSLRCLGLPK